MKNLFICLTLFMLLFPGVVPAQEIAVDEVSSEALLTQANTFFREAMETADKDLWKAKKLYEKAAAYYQKIIADGKIENGKLYYNIGNAYFKMGDIGRGILNYLKAEEYIPNDSNLRQNLEYARSRRLDQVEDKEETLLVKTIFFWHYGLNSSTRLVIFTVFFVLVWGIAILKLFFKQGLLNFFLIVCLVMATLFGGSLLVELSGHSGEIRGVVLSTEVTARKGDSTTYEPSFQDPLHAGTEFRLIEARRNWYNIELTDGRSCWLPADAAGLVE